MDTLPPTSLQQLGVSDIGAQVATASTQAAARAAIGMQQEIIPPAFIASRATGLGVKIFEDINRVISTDFDPAQKRFGAANTYYVDTVSGADGNTGASWASPWARVHTAITAANATGQAATILVKATDRIDINRAWGDRASTVPINLICEDGVAIMHHGIRNYTWSLTSGKTNTFETTVSGFTPAHVVDTSATTADAMGKPKRLIARASIDLVEDNPGSYYISGTTVYIHPWDSRTTSIGSLVFVGADTRPRASAGIYVENCEFRMGQSAFEVSGSGDFCFVNTGFGQSVSSNGLTVLRDAPSKGWLFGAYSFSNYLDGLNYHCASGLPTKAPDVIEVESKCWSDGWSGTGQNNNSTMHEDGAIIRVNGEYVAAENRCVHDISASLVWCINCTAGASRYVGADVAASAAFMLGDTAIGYFDRCKPIDGSLSAFYTTSNTTATFEQSDMSRVNYLNGTVSYVGGIPQPSPVERVSLLP